MGESKTNVVLTTFKHGAGFASYGSLFHLHAMFIAKCFELSASQIAEHKRPLSG